MTGRVPRVVGHVRSEGLSARPDGLLWVRWLDR